MLLYSIVVTVFASQATAAVPGGVLTVESGLVQLVRKGQPARPCRRREPLLVGDKLLVGKAGQALVYLAATQELWRVPTDTSVTVAPKALTLLSGTKPTLAGQLQTVRADPGRGFPVHLASVVRGDESTLSPSGTVRNGPITLTWTPKPGTASTTIELLTSQGQTFATAALTSTQMPSYSIPMEKLQEGTWYRVRVSQRGKRDSSGIAPFTLQEVPLRLLPVAKRQELEKAEASLRSIPDCSPLTLGLMQGELYADLGLTSEFPETLALAFGDKKGSGEAQWQLGQWYERALQAEAAHNAYKCAWELGVRDPELQKSLKRTLGKTNSRK